MKKVLVIEDEANLRKNIQEVLELENFDIIVAADGAIGLTMAREAHPDLIICDVMMPHLNGYGVLEALRQDPNTALIPLIFLTAKSDRMDFRQGMEIGANDYLTKPFSPKELLTAIATQLGKQAIAQQESQRKLDTLRKNISSSLPHEFLTPLNGIIGLSSLLIDDYKTMPEAEVIECLQDIHGSGERLWKSIEKFLLFADLKLTLTDPERVQAHRQSLNQASAKELITFVANDIAKRSQREGDIQLELNDVLVNISGKHLKKIVEELLDNAFKFSQLGTSVRLIANSDSSRFNLYVIDRGRGISFSQIAEIEAYMQFERRKYEQQGLGLGLAIVQSIVELYGGTFTVKSIVSQETIVHITLNRVIVS